MAYQISLNDEEYSILAEEAARSGSGKQPEEFLHEIIQRLRSSSQVRRPLTLRELAEKQYREGKISHIPTKEPLTEEEREALEQSAQWFAEGKPLSEMIIEDRGPY
jgi:hypothetical protein